MLLTTLALAPCLVADVPMPDPADYVGKRIVQVQIDDPMQVRTLMDGGLDCLACTPGPGSHQWVVDDIDLATLSAMGLPWTPVVDDLSRYMEERNAERRAARAARGDLFYDDYRTLDEFNDRMDTLVALYPNVVTPIVIGQSHEGRDIRGFVLSLGEAQDRPAILFNGCQHAREWISPMTVMYIGEELAKGAGADATITELLQRLEVIVIPVVNPDGFEHTYAAGGYRFWRKNRRDNGGSCMGVDLNRNWGIDWNGGQSTSEDPCSDIYVGPGSMSEPEVQALGDYCLNHGNIVAQIDYHSHGDLILEPLGYSSTPPPDWDEIHELGLDMRSAIGAVHGRYYTTDTPCNILYCASGTLIDWPHEVYDSMAYCIELRGPGFDAPPSEIRPCAEENLQGAIAMMARFGESVSITLPGGAPEYVHTEDDTTFAVRLEAINESVDTATLRWRGGDGGFIPSDLVYVDGEDWEATLPPFICESDPEFFIAVETVEGSSVYLPAEGMTAPFAAEPISDAEISFEHSGEDDAGWTSAGDAIDGQWEVGTPVGGGLRGDPPQDADGNDLCWLTDNVEGNSDVDGGTATLITPPLNYGGPGLVLRYSRWFDNTFGAAPGEDFFRVAWTDDLASGSWNPVEVVGPDGAGTTGGWIDVEIDLDALAVPPVGPIWLRFNAEDLGAGSVVEAGVDAISLTRVICEDDTEPCAGDVDGDGMVGVNDILAVLAAFGGDDASGDANGDGFVDVNDILTVVGAWGDC